MARVSFKSVSLRGVHPKVIGFAMVSTGYGTDGHIWGGEVLVADYRDFHRVAQLDYAPMLGGEKVIREPWRMAVSYLAHHFGREFLRLPLLFVEGLDRSKVDLLLCMRERGVNSPLTLPASSSSSAPSCARIL